LVGQGPCHFGVEQPGVHLPVINPVTLQIQMQHGSDVILQKLFHCLTRSDTKSFASSKHFRGRLSGVAVILTTAAHHPRYLLSYPLQTSHCLVQRAASEALFGPAASPAVACMY
jgi:hypothetical protein